MPAVLHHPPVFRDVFYEICGLKISQPSCPCVFCRYFLHVFPISTLRVDLLISFRINSLYHIVTSRIARAYEVSIKNQ